MNLKNIMFVIAIVLASLILITLVIFGTYKFAPEILGFKKSQTLKSVDEPTIEFKNEPKVVLSRSQYENWLQKSFDAKVIAEENNFLLNYRITLQDSIKKLNSKIDSVNQILALAIDSLTKKDKLLVEMNKDIKKLLSKIDAKDKEIAKFKQSEEQQPLASKALTDSARQVVYSTFAKIYENSNPKEVAKIFENLEDEHVISILRLMSKKKAGKIIEELKPERSAAILQYSFIK